MKLPNNMTWRQYSTYLRSEAWSRIRRKAIDDHGGSCEVCDSAERLHVHHIRYRNLFDVTSKDLVVLCEDCHNDLHFVTRKYQSDSELEIQDIKMLLEDFKKTPEYFRRKNKIEAKKLRKERQTETRRKPAKSIRRTINTLVQECNRHSYSLKSVDALISQLQSLQSERRQKLQSLQE